MSDIFISYASSDRERARLLAEALGRRGWTVWWDREIPFGESFDRVIERELAGARSVIVLWSRVSVDSDWVRNEARQGLKRDVLIPAQIDAVDLPLEFSNVQTADLTDWRPDKPHAEFDRLVQRLKVLLGEPTAVASPAPRPPEREPSPAHRPDASVSWQGPERRKRGKRAAWLLALLALLAVIGGGGYWIISQSYAEVPSLVGMRPSAAEKVLIDAGLKLGPPTSAESAETPPGTILSQSPESRTRVAKGSIVNVVVAVRPKVALPKLGALPLEQAQETLKAAGLAVGRVSYRRTEAAQPGTVIEQGPTAGEKVELGVAVDLVVAAAVESEVPNLASLPFSKARAALERAGLRVGSRKTASLMPGGETAEAVVRSQSPPAGAHVPPGSRIDLVVDEPGVPVPAVTKVTLDEAKATVERSGLALGAVKLAPVLICTQY